ncbi:hypothetical protein PA598K_04835 [Paenibacillus sp. 598K]|uniref:hypothetical protein n=1 Tax=Paenibacillus sp. 598K TaxID=1117987 RepID=UPI000FF9C8D1|nr:hypothetical protein [Paenibacillus sp. 598K]GBF76369.1 hypothetical protein PA598K_04835 [Paenibacillus sp. 598K]
MSDKSWLVIQYPLKSLKGSKRDHWLREKVSEYVEMVLSEDELGYVDGSDIGRSVADPNTYVLNIFCVVTQEAVAIAQVKRVLRESRLDHTRVKIATMPEGGETYTLQYAARKGVTDFSL